MSLISSLCHCLARRLVEWPTVSLIGLASHGLALHLVDWPVALLTGLQVVVLFAVLSWGPLWLFGLSWVLCKVVSSGEGGSKGKSEPRQKIGARSGDAPLGPPISWVPPLFLLLLRHRQGPHPSGEGRGTG